jgi:hypothetical protein
MKNSQKKATESKAEIEIPGILKVRNFSIEMSSRDFRPRQEL